MVIFFAGYSYPLFIIKAIQLIEVKQKIPLQITLKIAN